MSNNIMTMWIFLTISVTENALTANDVDSMDFEMISVLPKVWNELLLCAKLHVAIFGK